MSDATETTEGLDRPAVGAIAPWFGSNRMLAPRVGELLAGCAWLGVPFAGGMSELQHLKARTVIVGDLHAHVLNLAAVVRDPTLCATLRVRLEGTPFHAGELERAQAACGAREALGRAARWDGHPDVAWAADYFVCAWMARNGKAGTGDEFDAGLSVRWEAAGGDSAVRFRNAHESLTQWHRLMRRMTFVRMDCFDFLAKCKDRAGHGIYCDPPWPTDGAAYKHPFSEADQRKLAARLGEFTAATVVVRYGDHELIRELYPADRWEWVELEGRTGANRAKAEVLLVNRKPGG